MPLGRRVPSPLEPCALALLQEGSWYGLVPTGYKFECGECRTAKGLHLGLSSKNKRRHRNLNERTRKKKKGSSWNRVGKFEGLKGRKARYFRDLLLFCRVQNLAQMLDGKDIETSSAALGYVFI